MNLVLGQKALGPPQLLIEVMHRGSSISRDETGGIQSSGAIPNPLQHRQLNQRLCAGEIQGTVNVLILII